MVSLGHTSRRLITALVGAAMVTAGASGGAGHAATRPATLAMLLYGGADAVGLSTLSPPQASLAGTVPAGPEPGVASGLFGVYCASSTSCWAVGEYKPTADVGLNEMLHWNGSRWVRVSVPSPAGAGSGDVSVLVSIRCARASDCWAVGEYQRNPGAILAQALHWNGRKWLSSPVPQPGGTSSFSLTVLRDVNCPSVTSCWAVGEFGTQGQDFDVRNQVLHWNGKKWARARIPQPAGTATDALNVLASVRCSSVTSCLAVGAFGTVGSEVVTKNQVLRWNGRKWMALSVVSPGGTDPNAFSTLDGLACSSSANCWAVGLYLPAASPRGQLNQVLHWNGSTWTQVVVPEPGGTTEGARQELFFAACGSPVNCWAVGDFAPAGLSNGSANQALHWDGGAWSVVDTPNPADVSSGDSNTLAGLRCPGATSCWAVGVANMSGQPKFGQVLHWDGTNWSVR